MANQITVSPEEIRATASRYQSELQTVMDGFQSYVNAINKLSNDWTGVAFAAMSAKVAVLTRNLYAAHDRINDAVSELKQSADLYEQVENDLGGKMGSIEAGSPPPFN